MYGMARFSWQQLRRFVYDNLHNDDYKSKVSNCINYLLIILIVGNVAAVLLESINEIYKLYKPYFDLFENISIVIFSGEYLLRFWSVIEEDREEAAWKQRIRWMKSGGAIVADTFTCYPTRERFIPSRYFHFSDYDCNVSIGNLCG